MSPKPIGPEELDTPPIIDFRALRGWLRVALRAVRRRKRAVAGVALAAFVLAAVVVSLMPRTYSVESRLLAQRSQVLQIRGDEPGGAGSPTRSAAELILKRDNLIAIVKQTNLVKEWFDRREPIFKVKDFIFGLFIKPRTEQQNIEMLADVLRTRTYVTADDSTVTIQVNWRDGLLAYRLVSAAQRSFLEARHVQEVSTIAESKAILDGHAAEVRQQIDAEVTKLQSLRESKEAQEKRKAADTRAAAVAAEVPSAAPAAARPMGRAPEPAASASPAETQARQRRVAELPVMIETNERTINELEGFRLRRLSELQAKLQEQRAIYTDAHPAVADVKEALAAAAHESPQVTKLRTDTKQMRGELEKLRQGGNVSPGARYYGGGHASTAGGRGLGDVIRIEQESADERDPEVEYARARLRFAIETFQSLEEQIHKANIDLETAQAAFKYRYTVVTPPELPRGPIAPKVPLILIAALVGGLLIGVVTAVGLELREGVIFEPWQVEHQLSLRVLSIVTAPQLTRGGDSDPSG